MDKFVKIALRNDRRVHLTVVYFGQEGLSEARAIMSKVLMTRGSGGNNQNLRLLALNETFSRGKGLRVGAERSWNLGERDVLLFMCDVDVVFSARFLDRFVFIYLFIFVFQMARNNNKFIWFSGVDGTLHLPKKFITRSFSVFTIHTSCTPCREGMYRQKRISSSFLETLGSGGILVTG